MLVVDLEDFRDSDAGSALRRADAASRDARTRNVPSAQLLPAVTAPASFDRDGPPAGALDFEPFRSDGHATVAADRTAPSGTATKPADSAQEV